MRRLFAALCCLIAAHGQAGSAQTGPSELIADRGLAGAIAAITAETQPEPSDQLALAGMMFLRAVEKAYQARWRVGYVGNDIPLPLFSNELPINMAPEPVRAETINRIFQEFLADMARADAVLASIPPGSDPVFEFSLPDAWFDINMNGSRDDKEDFVDVALQAVMSRREIRQTREALAENPDQPNPLTATIRFDEADLFWLRAYTNAISGVSELVLAFDPAPEIKKALDLRQAIFVQRATALSNYPELQALLEEAQRFEEMTADEQQKLQKTFESLSQEQQEAYAEAMLGDQSNQNFLTENAHFVDIVAVIVETLRHTPDQARVAAAQAHFLQMVEHNRKFWTLVNQEVDNDREWIPNAGQQAALGIEMPGGLDEAWLAVLTDAERMLKGELLVPFWRYAPSHGIDIQAWVDNPSALNVIAWMQGTATLPYARQGEVMTTQNWDRFQRLVRRQTGLFIFMLN